MLCGGLLSFMVQLTMVLRLFKKIIICFLALQLAFFSPFANANASPGGWTFSAFDAVAGIVSAVKNGAKATATVAKSPIVSKIGKGIVGGAIAGVAIPLAISQISGIALSSLDWVLDPANNAIKYKDKNPPVGYYYVLSNPSVHYSTAEAAGRAACAIVSLPYHSLIETNPSSSMAVACLKSNGTAERVYIGYKGATSDNTYKTIPIPTVADKIYDNAKTGHADSVSAVTLSLIHI